MSAMDDANVPMGGAVADAAAAAATDTPLMPAEGETGPSTSPYASGSKSTSSSIVAAVNATSRDVDGWTSLLLQNTWSANNQSRPSAPDPLECPLHIYHTKHGSLSKF